MKTKQTLLAVILAALASTSIGYSNPSDKHPHGPHGPHGHPPKEGHPPPHHHSSEPVTFLGVVTKKIDRLLRGHLEIPNGFGIIVDGTVEGSAAMNAGVQPFDILLKFDDQKLISPEHLAILVKTEEPDTKVTLTLLRKGAEKQISVALGSIDSALLKPGPRPVPCEQRGPRHPRHPQWDCNDFGPRACKSTRCNRSGYGPPQRWVQRTPSRCGTRPPCVTPPHQRKDCIDCPSDFLCKKGSDCNGCTDCGVQVCPTPPIAPVGPGGPGGALCEKGIDCEGCSQCPIDAKCTGNDQCKGKAQCEVGGDCSECEQCQGADAPKPAKSKKGNKEEAMKNAAAAPSAKAKDKPKADTPHAADPKPSKPAEADKGKKTKKQQAAKKSPKAEDAPKKPAKAEVEKADAPKPAKADKPADPPSSPKRIKAPKTPAPPAKPEAAPETPKQAEPAQAKAPAKAPKATPKDPSGNKPPSAMVKAGLPVHITTSSQELLIINNEQGEVTIAEIKNQPHHMEIKGTDGKTVFSGDFDPKKGVAGLPKEAQQHLKQMKLEELEIFQSGSLTPEKLIQVLPNDAKASKSAPEKK